MIRHHSTYMYQPLVENLLQHKDKGTSCVLTQTNEEAVILIALLRKHGINSKLIQSMDGLRFWNMAEMRYFLKYIDKRIKTPLITEELWEEAKHATFSIYDRSLGLMYVKRCVEQFEQTNRQNISVTSKNLHLSRQWKTSATHQAPMLWYQPSTRLKAGNLMTYICSYLTAM